MPTTWRPAYELRWFANPTMNSNSPNDRLAVYSPRIVESWTPCVIFLHGDGSGADFLFGYTQGQAMAGIFARMGIMVACIDAGDYTLGGSSGPNGLSSWGTPACTARIESWRALLESLGAATSKLVVMGASMGTYLSLAYARDYPQNVGGIINWNPAIDVVQFRANRNNPPTAGAPWSDLANNIDLAWGISSSAPLPSDADPFTQTTIQGLPYLSWYTNNDPYVPAANTLYSGFGAPKDGTAWTGVGNWATRIAAWIGSSAVAHLDPNPDGHFAINSFADQVEEAVWFVFEHLAGSTTPG